MSRSPNETGLSLKINQSVRLKNAKYRRRKEKGNPRSPRRSPTHRRNLLSTPQFSQLIFKSRLVTLTVLCSQCRPQRPLVNDIENPPKLLVRLNTSASNRSLSESSKFKKLTIRYHAYLGGDKYVRESGIRKYSRIMMEHIYTSR